ncbi:glucosamine-6-phosphate deaminase [Fictibacillus aquaticus]|uniref:Glucosamine-6-phosphate deaminase n=1 Tax=Fictibacillus aquaticus TaxID=2021314 RepID=A0A235F4Y6_9BACL|nr:glucosamine-6-phosphate deaminase [Fictibacillus aquaticus]OYD56163.1 glucosamine-6-phosphate deaminase [Fictibacillus aquaticus]
MRVIAVADYEEMSVLAAEMIEAKVRNQPDAVLGLATGGTPLGTYRHLVESAAARHLSFRRVKTVNLDEYVGIPASHPQSYHSYMKENVFDPLGILPENSHLPNGETLELTAECARYDKLIQELNSVDLQVLGIGQNGHIGFNEPGTPFNSSTHVVELTESTLRANAKYFKGEKQPVQAITMGIGTILKSKEILLLASGSSKKEAISALMSGIRDENVPATALVSHPSVTVIADSEALAVESKRV